MTRARHFPARERGAALLVVLGVVLLLASFASLGLARLRATSADISVADRQSKAGLLAASGAGIGAAIIGQLKARTRNQPQQLQQLLAFPVPGATLHLQFLDGGNCFNLNSLLAPPAVAGASAAAPQARADDLARLLQAAGVDGAAAQTVAAATAARLAQTGMLWADAAEWRDLAGAAIWQLAGRHLCALPTRESSLINLNGLRADDAPVLVAAGLDIAAARRAIAAKPAGGWGSGGEFWQQVSAGGTPVTAAAQVAGTRSRWIRMRVSAEVAGAAVRREYLLDTSREPAQIVASRWLPPAAKPAATNRQAA